MPKKSTKKSKKSVLSDRVNLRSPKHQLLLFVVVFAVIGGIFAAYKSFAANTTQVAFANQITEVLPTTTQLSESTGSKKGSQVWELSPNSGVKANITLPMLTNRAPFQICANLKAEQTGMVDMTFGTVAKGGGVNVKVEASSEYKKYCTGNALLFSEIYVGLYKPGIVNYTTGKVRVGYISLEYDNQFVVK